MSPWTDLIKKIYKEEHDKNSEFQFKDAMKLASKRKSEMGSSTPGKKSSKSKRTRKSRKRGKRQKGTRKR